MPPRTAITTIRARPDLVPVVADWIWRAFWQRHGVPLAQVEGLVATCVAPCGPPQSFVLLADGTPAGTAGLIAHDLDVRPDLTPWFAGLYVPPDFRGRGFGRALVRAVEDAARQAGIPTLWLYTHTAEGLYARLGWRRAETVTHRGVVSALMCRDLETEG